MLHLLVSLLKNIELRWLKEQIRKNGIYRPILMFEDGTILDGHKRIKVAKELGIEKVPAIVILRTSVKLESIHLAPTDWFGKDGFCYFRG